MSARFFRVGLRVPSRTSPEGMSSFMKRVS